MTLAQDSIERLESLADLVPPRWDQEVEEALAGALLDRPGTVWPRVVGRILDEDFHDARIAKVWEVSARLCAAGVTLTLESASSALREAGAYSAVGGARFLHELVAKAATGVWAEQWVEDLLRTAAVRRVQRAALRTLMASAHGSYENVVQEAAGIEKALNERVTVAEPKTLSACADEFADAQDSSPQDVARVSTGFLALNALLGGFSEGQLVTIAARPAMGKTSLGLAMLLAIGRHIKAQSEEGVCLFVSLEMPYPELFRRMISQMTGIPEYVLKNIKGAEKDDREKVKSSTTPAANELKTLPILIQDSLEWLHDLQSTLYRLRLRHKRVSCVVIDYLQLVRARLDRRDATREQEVAEVSRTLKKLAKEFKCPILALSQLNRACESRPNKRPMLADLRESGAVEQDSDVVMFVYRDEVYRSDSADRGIAEIIVAKQRSGPIGTARLNFESSCTRFTDKFDEIHSTREVTPMRGESIHQFSEVPPEEPTRDGIETAWEDES